MDDFLDFLDVLLAADTYDNVGRPILRGLDLAKNAGAGQIAKGYGPISWGIRGVDYAVEKVGIPVPPGVREQLRAEAAQARAGAFTGDLLPGDVAGAVPTDGTRATDHGARPVAADQVVAGVFDP